ncbi:MAG: hypothetical protein DI536_14110 [Archangium gephyra]|uniref:Uncharacterized protein n=1 Tax=Archangium gephyra TaxID=48 RepID=A0A2W5TFK8_9BACT|nr:MAG: hypothetical protein DI536_14110 [Archangium gephyra]
MHRIDADAHVGNMFSEGDPSIPRMPTQIDTHWLNAVQEELMSVVLAADIAPVKGTWNQVLTAIDKLNPVKAACTVSCDGSGGVELVGAARNVAGVSIEPGGGGLLERVRVTFTNEVDSPIGGSVLVVKQPSVGTLPAAVIVPIQQSLTSTYFEFAISSAPESFGTTSSVYTPTVAALSQRYAVTVIGA